jgi:hypothetical protein
MSSPQNAHCLMVIGWKEEGGEDEDVEGCWMMGGTVRTYAITQHCVNHEHISVEEKTRNDRRKG